jgi:hypothetical protein
MTETSFPFDAGAGADSYQTQWREMARYWRGSGVFSGVLNALAVYADSSGMQVKVPTGEAWVDGFKYKNDAEIILAISAAHATLGRIDRIVLRLDVAAHTLVVAVLAGTPAASPAAPALTQDLTGTYEISLAKITIAAAATNLAAGTVTDERTYSLATFNSPLAAEYDSGWFAVAYNNSYTKAHGLGGAPKFLAIYWCSTATPAAGDYIDLIYTVSQSTLTTVSMDDTNLYATAPNDSAAGTKRATGYTNGAVVNSASGYWRILAWK